MTLARDGESDHTKASFRFQLPAAVRTLVGPFDTLAHIHTNFSLLIRVRFLQSATDEIRAGATHATGVPKLSSIRNAIEVFACRQIRGKSWRVLVPLRV